MIDNNAAKVAKNTGKPATQCAVLAVWLMPRSRYLFPTRNAEEYGSKNGQYKNPDCAEREN